ncbi:MAG: tyrosine-type recombinase/integrase [bacterium]|nr:tyrosine-type recombinase/integrase [bacterium]
MSNLTIIKEQELITAIDRLNSLPAQFLKELDVSDLTKTCYQKGLKRFLNYLGEKNISNPSREHILAYKNDLKNDLKPLTINLYLSATRRFFGWLEGYKIYPDIAKGVKGFKRPKGFLRNELNAIQTRRLLNGIDKSNIVGLRDYVLINLIVRTGLRSIEVINSNIGDIESKGGEMILKIKGKGRDEKDDFVLLTAETYNPLMDYLKARGKVNPDDPLFVSHSNNHNGKNRLTTRSIRRIVGDRLKNVGLKTEKISCHSLRHTAGSLAIEGGANVIQVQQMLRHSNINTTMIYIHNRDRIKFGAEKFIKF